MTLHEQAKVLVGKAGEDLTVLRELLSNAKVSDDIWGFHAQQAVEKLLKVTSNKSGEPNKATRRIATKSSNGAKRRIGKRRASIGFSAFAPLVQQSCSFFFS